MCYQPSSRLNPDLMIGVTGSRDGHPRVRLWMTTMVRAAGVPVLFVLGGARGVDAEAEAVCVEQNWPYAVLYADWKRYGKAAGARRNAEMVAMVASAREGVFLAFPGPKSRGTVHCMEVAMRAGLRVHRAGPITQERR